MAVGNYSRFDPIVFSTNGSVPFISSFNTALSETITATHTSSGLLTFSSAINAAKYNGVTITANATGFTISGGTTSKSFTVSNDTTVSGNPGTVTSVSVSSSNGFAGTVATSTSTPTITLTTSVTGMLKGNGTAISSATAGTDYSAGTSSLATGILKSTTSTGALSIAVAADFPVLNQSTTGQAGSVGSSVTFNSSGTGDVSPVTYNGSTARTISYNTLGAQAALSGTGFVKISGSTISYDNSTYALSSSIGNGTFGVSIGTAGATNTTVTWGTASGFTANASSNYTYDIKVGPALTALATVMTGATTGFIKKTAADTYTLDTNTYLTSESDTLATVTNRGASTSTVTTFSGGDGSNSSVKLSGYNQRGGVGFHGFLEATNTYASATNPNKYFRLNATGALEIINSSYTSNILYLTDDGKLGLGTTGPDSRLHISGSVLSNAGVDANSLLRIYNTANEVTGGVANYTGIAFGRDSVRSAITSGTYGDDYIKFFTNGDMTTPKATIDASGNLNITGSYKVNGVAVGGVTVTDDSTTNATYYPIVATTAGGSTLKTASTKISFNPSTGVLSAVQVASTDNGNGTNFKLGDDTWIGDINVANTFRVMGQQDNTKGYIVFGNGDNTTLGRSGTGALTYGGNAIITAGDTGTVTNTMLAGSIANGKLTNSTISGVSLGNNLSSLTLNNSGTGAVSGSTYNGSSAVTLSYNTIGAQAALSGTGFVKISGTTISYDSSTYLTAESDTLATVTGRGATTSIAVTLSGGITSSTLDSAASGTLTLGGTNATAINLGTADTTQTVNIGTGSGTTTINLGGSGDTVNIAGTLTYVNTTDLTVTDKFIILNKGGAAASGGISGIGIEEGSSTTGYFETNSGRTGWVHKAPASSGTFTLTPTTAAFDGNISTAVLTANRTYTLPDNTGTIALTSQLPTVNDGTLTLSIGSAAATNNTVIVGTGTGFSANTSSNATYSLKIGPALTALASTMTGATTGFLKKTAADTYTLDTNTYLTSESDTLSSVTGRGATTTSAITAPTYNTTNGAITSATLTTSTTTANQVVDTVAIATARTIKYLVSIVSGTAYQCSEILIIHDGTTAYMTEYGTILTSGNSLASFDSSISTGNLQLLVTPVNAATTIKVIRTIVNV